MQPAEEAADKPPAGAKIIMIFALKSEKLCIKNEKCCIKNDEFVLRMMNSADPRRRAAEESVVLQQNS